MNYLKSYKALAVILAISVFSYQTAFAEALLAGTEVPVQVTEKISSKKVLDGQTVKLIVTSPVVDHQTNKIVINSGAEALGIIRKSKPKSLDIDVIETTAADGTKIPLSGSYLFNKAPNTQNRRYAYNDYSTNCYGRGRYRDSDKYRTTTSDIVGGVGALAILGFLVVGLIKNSGITIASGTKINCRVKTDTLVFKPATQPAYTSALAQQPITNQQTVSEPTMIFSAVQPVAKLDSKANAYSAVPDYLQKYLVTP